MTGKDKPSYSCPVCGSHGTASTCCGQAATPNRTGRPS